MSRLDGASFLAHPHKALTFLGVSGCGKTRLSALFHRDAWFHYSIDYRIGTRYLTDPILDVVKRRMMADPVLAKLLKTDSIWLSHNITIENLTAVSDYIGKLGARGGGTPAGGLRDPTASLCGRGETSRRRPALFHPARRGTFTAIRILFTTPAGRCARLSRGRPVRSGALWWSIRSPFTSAWSATVSKKSSSVNSRHPSLCIIIRLFWNRLCGEFGREFEHEFEAGACDFEPDDFIRFMFPSLLEHRDVAYQNLVADSGLTIDSETLEGKTTGEEVLACIASQLDRTPVPVPRAWARRPAGLDTSTDTSLNAPPKRDNRRRVGASSA